MRTARRTGSTFEPIRIGRHRADPESGRDCHLHQSEYSMPLVQARRPQALGHYHNWLFRRDTRFLEKASVVLDLYHGNWAGEALGPDDYVLSADEKCGLQILSRCTVQCGLHWVTRPGRRSPNMPGKLNSNMNASGHSLIRRRWMYFMERSSVRLKTRTASSPSINWLTA